MGTTVAHTGTVLRVCAPGAVILGFVLAWALTVPAFPAQASPTPQAHFTAAEGNDTSGHASPSGPVPGVLAPPPSSRPAVALAVTQPGAPASAAAPTTDERPRRGTDSGWEFTAGVLCALVGAILLYSGHRSSHT